MSTPVTPEEMKSLGIPRHEDLHIALACTEDEQVYISHPDNCATRLTMKPLTECKYSRALDYGISLDRWKDALDRPYFVIVNIEGKLSPVEPVDWSRPDRSDTGTSKARLQS